MTLVLVHGNPETAAIWNDLIPLLDDDDVQAVSPPGFGSPLPDNFDATSDAYVEWLAAELSHFNSPVDLLGHDWGGGHVVRLACERPDLIRSWASDILGVFTPEYVWHD
ncbi:MAG: alpha/beta hydrolase, partial [Acidimicrobiales bacterium]|nr:alpha/beta hydrolase [Acidimicrobiales bacterium]